MAKPAAGTALNTSHALASGLTHALPLLEGAGTTITDAVTGTGYTISAALWSTDANGPILANPGQIDLWDGTTMPTTACTIAIGYRKRDTTNRVSGGFGFIGTTDPTKAGAHFPWSDGNIYWDYGGSNGSGGGRLTVPGLTFGTTMTNWAFLSSTTTGQSVWQNATSRGSVGSAPARTTGGGTWGTGRHAAQGPDLYDLAYVYVYNRDLSSGEIASLNTDPYQMFGTSSSLLLRRRRAA